MKRDHTGCIRAYYRSTRAYYASALPKENLHVMFGMYDPEGGSSGEMKMEWSDISEPIPTPELQVFDDAWHALSLFGDVLMALGELDSENINDDQFCALLDKYGFKDITPYENPNPSTDKLISVEIWESKAKELGLI